MTRRTVACIEYTDCDGLAADGLQTCDTCDEALIVARRIAAQREADVILYDADGVWLVTPSGDCELLEAEDCDTPDAIDEDDTTCMEPL